MEDFVGEEFETLGEGGDTVLLRARHPAKPLSWLIRIPGRGQRAVAGLQQLKHEHALAEDLHPDWAARPLAMARYQGRPALMLSDGCGAPLSAMIGQPDELSHLLRVAAGIAGALRCAHAHGLIHRDVKPANILVDADGKVRLTGFGLAIRTARDGQALSAPGAPAGSLPYMAPEQTGRMNRPVDLRSDLYSLGVTLYELLAGSLPFNAREPLEWVHSHVAREPIPLAGRRPDLPVPVAELVHRLLAKPPEERYQTADGVEHDLLRCLRDWESQRRIRPFPLGQHDAPHRLRPPDALYGREQPAAQLKAALDRVALQETMGVVLVSGPSGVGKSSVVHSLRGILAPPHGLFAAGKFDQYKRDAPYATLAQALREILEHILKRSGADQDMWRRALLDAVGVNGQLVVNLVPDLALLIGEQPPVADLPPREAQQRFDHVIRRLLAVFAQPRHPLALFLDDLQWLDKATLDLLGRLVGGGGIPHLLLVGAYRDDEIGPDHPLAGLIDTVRLAGPEVQATSIALAPLEEADLRRLVADTLLRDPADVVELARGLHARTGGNALFAIQFLTALEEEKLVFLDRATGRWEWDDAAVAAMPLSGSVADLIAGRLARFPARTRDILIRLACLGTSASMATLAVATGLSEHAIDEALSEVAREGLVLRIEGSYAFLHDRVQEGAYSLVPEAERSALHLQIARALSTDVAPATLSARIFEIANQFSRGLELLGIEILDGEAERARVAGYHLVAARRAKASSAHRSALSYTVCGLGLLDRGNPDHDRLGFDLELLQAECEFLSGELPVAEQRLRSLAARAASLADKAAATSLQITFYTAMDRSDRAIQACLAFLEGVGIHWSSHPSRDLVQREYERLRGSIGGAAIASLIDLPALDDPDSQAMLDVLAAALPPAFFSDEHLVCLILCRMANIAVASGNGDASALGFAYLGMVAGPYFGDYAAGYGFGKLGLDLVERRGQTRYRPRVLMTFAYHVVPWTRDIRSERPLLLRAFEEARETGDVTYGGFTSVTLITSMLAAGDRLDLVQRTAETRLGYVRQAKFGLCVDILTTQLQLIRSMRGLTPNFGTFDEAGFEEAAFEDHLRANPSLAIAACWYWIRKLQARFIADNPAAAVAAADQAEALLWTSSGHFEIADHHFFAALARAAWYGSAPVEDRAPLAAKLAAHLDQLRLWAANCPENFESRFALAGAEQARIEGREAEARSGYDRAIQSARRNGLPQIEAIANELGARFYGTCDLPTVEAAYLRDARAAYQRWGATGKVWRLEMQHPSLQPAPCAPDPFPADSSALAGIDLATLMETSQAMADQRTIDQLVTTLLGLVLEHAGASRGLLLLARANRLRIEAEAKTGPGGVAVQLLRDDAETADLPHAMIQVAIRERETIIIDDTRADGPFRAERFLRETEARSILCMPLVHQSKVVGLLYLENTRATHAFTSERIGILKLLASQAATSLENATLEEKEALLKEIHHRVKNNLQLVMSLLNLQAARIADPAVAALFADSRDRVRSMALVHEYLYRLGNYARVPMKSHLEAVCAHLARAYAAQNGKVALRMELDDVQLDLDRAVPCGLVVNELVSNALKHAFPDGRGGMVQVTLAAQDGACTLTVSDNGAGLPQGLDIAEVETLGLQLVADLTSQLHGTLAYSSAFGAEFTLTFPVKGRS